ncbi:NADP-dependent oxidoreductase domain-containing protein [Coniochaeta sp. 2T2.1]|nr:NADP-dependent oxidoreductase domain-containing protein [Coniochaeta sp. 2T2.1]
MMPNIPTRRLGAGGPLVPALGFGCMGLSEFYGKPLPDEERFKVLDRVVELGAIVLDTSDTYKDNEDVLARWLKYSGSRDKVFLCTKFGFSRGADGNPTVCSSPGYVRKACEKSLKRLGVDKIDLYYCHRVDPNTPIERTIEAMVQLKNEGRIDHIGLSEVSSDTLRRAHKIHPIAAVQLEYSPFALDIERDELKSPDDFDDTDFRKHAPKYSKENWHNNMQLVELLKSMAEKKGCTPGQLSLAWIMAQGEDIIPIPGTKRIKYLEENLGALDVNLSNEEEETIRKQIEKVEVVGERYSAALQGWCFGDTVPLDS